MLVTKYATYFTFKCIFNKYNTIHCLEATYTSETFGAVNDLREATVNDVLTISHHRIKHDLRLFNPHRHQHHWSLDILEVIKLGRVITEIVATLQYTQTDTNAYRQRATNELSK